MTSFDPQSCSMFNNFADFEHIFQANQQLLAVSGFSFGFLLASQLQSARRELCTMSFGAGHVVGLWSSLLSGIET